MRVQGTVYASQTYSWTNIYKNNIVAIFPQAQMFTCAKDFVIIYLTLRHLQKWKAI